MGSRGFWVGYGKHETFSNIVNGRIKFILEIKGHDVEKGNKRSYFAGLENEKISEEILNKYRTEFERTGVNIYEDHVIHEIKIKPDKIHEKLK